MDPASERELNRLFLAALSEADRASRHCSSAVAAARSAISAAALAQASRNAAEAVLDSFIEHITALRRAQGTLMEPGAEHEEEDDDDDEDVREGADDPAEQVNDEQQNVQAMNRLRNVRRRRQ